MTIEVGEVVSVKGTQVTIRVFEQSSKDTLFHMGQKYKGVSIREYIGIKRGFCLIVCVVEGEYLDESRHINDDNKKVYERKVDAKPIGYFFDGEFLDGIKYMPMIKDSVYLLREEQVSSIFSKGGSYSFTIGKMLKEEIPVHLPWNKIFNTHIGVFGNTGSGKSNTLTKLYSELFSRFKENIGDNSKFIIIDFNGEYVGEQIVSGDDYKRSYRLSTKNNDGDKFPIPSDNIWNVEILSLLFQATANTQTPFLNKVVEDRNKFSTNAGSFLRFIKSTFEKCFTGTSQRREVLGLLKAVADHLGDGPLKEALNKVSWWTRDGKNHYIYKREPRVWDYFEGDLDKYEGTELEVQVRGISTANLDDWDEIVIRIYLQLIRDSIFGYVQIEHIQPLLKRVERAVKDLKKTIVVKSNDEIEEFKMLSVLSLRACNQSMKKLMPLLIAKMFYQSHRDKVSNPADRTLHFIIDEAHNILSQQSSREHEVWKDYRLELFEEIIKEGRKFGMFLTLSSQRPADISPTIMSQIHNFFIHRLVNDKDLLLIDNTISTLDRLSKGLIPNLSKGSCIVTGSSFELPILMQVDYIENKESRPASDDVELEKIWGLA